MLRVSSELTHALCAALGLEQTVRVRVRVRVRIKVGAPNSNRNLIVTLT